MHATWGGWCWCSIWCMLPRRHALEHLELWHCCIAAICRICLHSTIFKYIIFHHHSSCVVVMHIKPSLLSQITDQSPHHLPQEMLQENMPPVYQPNLLTRMSSPDSLQGLSLSQTQGSIKMFSLTATLSLMKGIERGRSPKRQSMLRSSLSLPKHSLTTGQNLMRHLDCSSQLLRATIWWLELQRAREKHSTRCSAPPPLLYRIQMNHSLMRSLSPKELRLTSRHMHGLPVYQTNEQSYKTPLQDAQAHRSIHRWSKGN